MMRIQDDRYGGEPSPPLSSLIRIGEVTSIDPASCTARVTFDDDDGFTSYDLPVLQPNTLKNRDYRMPDIGEDAVCVFLPAGASEGFIIGSIYAGEVTPPSGSGDVRMVEFEDGTRLEYDRSAHALKADVQGTVDVKATGAVSVSSGEKVVITAPQIILNGAISSYSRTGGSGTMSVNGTMGITGNITGQADITASGISLKSHTHPGDSGGTTGSPS